MGFAFIIIFFLTSLNPFHRETEFQVGSYKSKFHVIQISLVVRKPVFGVSDTNRAVQAQKMARGLKFRIKIQEGLFYLCGENKGADQLRGYREADLRFCFRICKRPVFSRRG